MRYMENKNSHIKRYTLTPEEISYAKDHGAILDDLPMTNEEAICLLSQSLEQITLSDAADAFLYSHVPWMRGLLVSCYAKKLWNINYQAVISGKL